jgi:hypothetical protein
MCPKTRTDSGRNFGGPRVRRRQVVRVTAPDVYDHVGVALRYIRGPFTAVRGPLNDGHLVTVKLLNTLCDILLIFRNPEARTFLDTVNCGWKGKLYMITFSF